MCNFSLTITLLSLTKSFTDFLFFFSRDLGLLTIRNKLCGLAMIFVIIMWNYRWHIAKWDQEKLSDYFKLKQLLSFPMQLIPFPLLNISYSGDWRKTQGKNPQNTSLFITRYKSWRGSLNQPLLYELIKKRELSLIYKYIYAPIRKSLK